MRERLSDRLVLLAFAAGLCLVSIVTLIAAGVFLSWAGVMLWALLVFVPVWICFWGLVFVAVVGTSTSLGGGKLKTSARDVAVFVYGGAFSLFSFIALANDLDWTAFAIFAAVLAPLAWFVAQMLYKGGRSESAQPFGDRLRNIARLHEEGLISDEEFQKKKKEILGNI